MDDTKLKAPVYSREPIKITTMESPAEATETAESSRTEQAAESSKKPQTQSHAQAPTQTPTQTHTQTPTAPMTDLPKRSMSGGSGSLEEFVEFLKRTWRVWLMVAGVIFGLMTAVTVTQRASEWARKAREQRHDEAVATVTPERLLARCGQPAEDVTSEVYPVLMREMRYTPRKNETLVFAFSRTAEEKSDWVFLSMKDESGVRNYETPEAKIAAFPCLDSKK
jgi:hypothetical protein